MNNESKETKLNDNPYPFANSRDLSDVPEEQRKDIQFKLA